MSICVVLGSLALFAAGAAFGYWLRGTDHEQRHKTETELSLASNIQPRRSWD
jgi:hypothetical protein